MSRRIKRMNPKPRSRDERDDARPFKARSAKKAGPRPGAKPGAKSPRFAAERAERRPPKAALEKAALEKPVPAKPVEALLPPKHILNSPTKLMKSEGYGAAYEYDHDAPDAFSGQDYFPEALGRQTFYDPPDRGFEREIRKRLDYWAKLRKERGGT